MSLAAVLIGRKRKYVPVGWFWYLGMLVPVLGFVQVGLQGYADRYAYLPNIGLYLLLTWAIVDLAKRWRFRRQILAVAATIALVALIYCARAQASYWRNSETLWHHTLDVTANNDVAHTNLGNLLPAAEAVPHYEKALQIAPHTMLPLNNLAWIRATSPDPFQRDGAKALELAKEANQLSGGKDPVFVRTLAAAYAENGQFTEAIETAQRALPLAVAQDNSALASDLRNNIDNFRRNIPVRDPSLANAHP
jgi:tetratricopeptide (TPR) repeat protein